MKTLISALSLICLLASCSYTGINNKGQSIEFESAGYNSGDSVTLIRTGLTWEVSTLSSNYKNDTTVFVYSDYPKNDSLMGIIEVSHVVVK